MSTISWRLTEGKALVQSKSESAKIEQIEALRPSLRQAYVKGKNWCFCINTKVYYTPFLLGKMEQELGAATGANKMLLADLIHALLSSSTRAAPIYL